ncbi:MAG: diacylglycerol kinase family lipid kinase [Gemmatimonadaceae bacterium]|nr:diacylglycerol kinase family lipid kinase [Gemmatimonadaceae bacterium]
MKDRVCVILNPASGRGKGRKAEARIRAAFQAIGVTSFRETAKRGDEAVLVRKAIAEGFSTIVAAGGDGTWSNVGRAILREGAGQSVALALIAAGTGNDLAKSVGAPATDYEMTARLVASDSVICIDAGRIGDDFFLNSVGFGFDAAVLATIEKMSWLRGSAVYTVAAMRQLFTYAGMTVSTDDGEIPSRTMMIIVANGGYLGGAFHIAPAATVTDGTLDTVVIGDMPAVQRLKLFGAAMKGLHIARPGVSTIRGTQITLHFEAPPVCQRDGELDQLSEATVTLSCMPAALKIVG